MMKKILMLGGTRYLLPVIKSAHNKHYKVITCDYIPDNIAHKYSDEYYNLSITDKDQVLKLAKSLDIDGIMSFGTDPGVETAAYVAEKMNLPSCGSYETVCILQRKSLFREYLSRNGFNVPRFMSFRSIGECKQAIDAFTMPVIVKPTDSAGSKGVMKVCEAEELPLAVDNALKYSRNGEFIVEEFIDPDGFASDSDCFSVDGKLAFYSFSNQHFDKRASNPFTPSAYSWPSSMPDAAKEYLVSELDRLIGLMALRTSLYNVETRIGKNGKPYIMEFSPRGGGNRISEILSRATGVDLIQKTVMAAVGESVEIPETYAFDGFWAECILHSYVNGKYDGIFIDPSVLPYVQEIDEWVKPGDEINVFTGANAAVGTIVFKFADKDFAASAMTNIFELIKVKTK